MHQAQTLLVMTSTNVRITPIIVMPMQPAPIHLADLPAHVTQGTQATARVAVISTNAPMAAMTAMKMRPVPTRQAVSPVSVMQDSQVMDKPVPPTLTSSPN